MIDTTLDFKMGLWGFPWTAWQQLYSNPRPPG